MDDKSKTEETEKTERTKQKLYVKMFGGFSVTWEGHSLLGKRARETQFTYLLQMLLHHRKNGVSRRELEEVLFGERDIENRFHAMQSIIYNAKKKLRGYGLPNVNYIEIRNERFYFTDEIPVEEDAEEFEKIYRRMVKQERIESQGPLCEKALRYYTGDFLDLLSGTLWVASEAKRYNAMFFDCVNVLVEYYKETKQYNALYELGCYASRTDPFCEWEIVTMDALVNLGKYDQAYELYSRTADRYFEERGLRTSENFSAMLQKLGDKIQHPVEVLDTIQFNLVQDRGSVPRGGYLCTYPVFQGIYNVVMRMMERTGISIYLMLCTIVDSKRNPMREGDKLDELSDKLGEAICTSIRSSDVVNRYGKCQYLVLLFNTTRESCTIIQKRINYNFIVGRQRTGVEYYVNSVFQDHLPE